MVKNAADACDRVLLRSTLNLVIMTGHFEEMYDDINVDTENIRYSFSFKLKQIL